MMHNILSMLIWLPIIGGLLALSINLKDKAQEAKNARLVALWFSLITLLISIFVFAGFDKSSGAMQHTESHAWLPQLNIMYALGIDSISLLLIVLTTVLTPLCICVSWTSVTNRVKEFMAYMLLLEGAVIGVFSALDMVLFYIFWEALLIPMFLLIGIWGGENRVYAALKFFIYTFVGSILMLVAIVYMYMHTGTFNVMELQQAAFSPQVQMWLWLAFFAAFAVKVPMWPFHTWLPDAHVQAPTAGSVILAGVLLKLGAYGFLRFSLPMFPDASQLFAPLVVALSIVAIIYTALVAFAQQDIKKMIAYSSVSHMGFVTLGIFAGTQDSINGAVLQMINHGIVSAALFMLIGVIYERMHTRDITRFGGIVQPLPTYAFIMLVFTLASVALPGTNSFVGEFMILMGSFPTFPTFTALATSGVVLGAIYMLWLYRKMVLGEAVHGDVKQLRPLTLMEKIMFVPLMAGVVYLGIMPTPVLNMLTPATQPLVEELAMPQRLSLTPVEAAANSHHGDSHAETKGHH